MKSFRRILAVKLADLGDALLIVPALRNLKKAYPAARLDVLTTATGGAGLDGLPYIDRLLIFDKYQFDNPRALLSPARISQLAAFGLDLRRQSYDAVIFFHHFSLKWGIFKFRGLALAAGAPWRVGLHNGTPRADFLNLSVPDRGFGGDGCTERAYWRQLVEKLTGQIPGAPYEYDERPEIAIGSDDHRRANALLAEVRGQDDGLPVVAFGAGSGLYSLSRRWPAANFAKVADGLIEQYGAKIALLGSAGEGSLNEEIRAQCKRPAAVVNLAGRTDRPHEVAAFLQGCRLFVGNDGGLAQLAGVAGTKSVVVFGPTNPVAWSPFGTEPDANGFRQVQIVQAQLDLPCRPCLYRGLSLGSRLGCAPRPCLTAISPAQVLETIQGLI